MDKSGTPVLTLPGPDWQWVPNNKMNADYQSMTSDPCPYYLTFTKDNKLGWQQRLLLKIRSLLGKENEDHDPHFATITYDASGNEVYNNTSMTLRSKAVALLLPSMLLTFLARPRRKKVIASSD